MKKYVLVTTHKRGTFVGYTNSRTSPCPDKITLTDARMIIRWGTTDGVFQLAKSGPTESTKPSALVPRTSIQFVDCVTDVTPEAREKWLKIR